MNTGEFAKYCGTEKRTLFYYDQMGLLKPMAIHENGYREYAPGQIETMDMIKILQAAGFTLKQIREIITGGAEIRRTSFFKAVDSIDDKIHELEKMKAYIERKEKLWKEYCDFRDSGIPYRYQYCRLTYFEKAISSDDHFFGFIQDGDYDLFSVDTMHQLSVMKEDEKGVCKEGKAICFFLEMPSESGDPVAVTQDKLQEFGFRGENRYYMRSIPHLLIEQSGTAIIKVTVFGEFPSDQIHP
ncbi:MAG: MerR family transcriptional regulator [Lachnospiraceae bacterium]